MNSWSMLAPTHATREHFLRRTTIFGTLSFPCSISKRAGSGTRTKAVPSSHHTASQLSLSQPLSSSTIRSPVPSKQEPTSGTAKASNLQLEVTAGSGKAEVRCLCSCSIQLGQLWGNGKAACIVSM